MKTWKRSTFSFNL